MLKFHGNENYIASEELLRSVNIAAALKKLLLIKGEPGTSELLDWIRSLQTGKIPLEVLKGCVPFAGVLLKKTEDLMQVYSGYVY